MYNLQLAFYFIFFHIKNEIFSLNSIDLNENDLVKFRHEDSNGFSNMLLKNQHIYLTGTNYVFKLNSLNISDKSEENYRERSILPTIDSNFNSSIKENGKNYVSFLGSRDFLNDLIICGTNLGQPHLYDLKMTDLSNQLEYNGNYLCTGVSNQMSLGLISYDVNYLKYQSIKKGIMYSAVWHSLESSVNHGIFSRYGIYRKEIEFNKNFIKTHFSPHWLWEPQFLSVIEDSEFIYYFFKEFSIEEFKINYPNFNMSSTQNLSDFTQAFKSNLTIYSRVARVCKNDKGMSSSKHSFLNNLWASFRKIKMECSCDGHFAIFNNLILVKPLESDPNKLLGIFYHKYNEKEMSVICEFGMSELRQKLKTTKFHLNANQFEFEDIYKCDLNQEAELLLLNAKNEELDADIFYPDLNEKDQDKFNLFLSKNTLLDAKFVGSCKNILPFEVKSLAFTKSFIYLSVSKNKIIQIRSDDYAILHEINLPFSSSNKIANQILVSEKNNLIYIATLDEVNQIDLNLIKTIDCNKNEYCSACLKENGCQWNSESTPHCNPLSESVFEKNNECSSVITEDLEYEENQTIILNCGKFSKILLYRVEWYKNDINLSKTNERFIYSYSNKADLILINIKFDFHSGLYTCKIDGKEIIRKINLKILKNSNLPSDRESLETFQKNVDEWKNDTKNLKLKMLELENLINITEC